MLLIERVKTIQQAMQVRQIYNENLEALSTRALQPITEEEQLDWFLNVGQQNVRLWLHYDNNQMDSLIGFSMLTYREGFHTPLFAIRKKYHGHGYSHWFIRHYIEQAATPLAGTQLQSNKAIVHLNKRHGWQLLFEKDGVEYLYHPGKAFENAYKFLLRRSDELQPRSDG